MHSTGRGRWHAQRGTLINGGGGGRPDRTPKLCLSAVLDLNKKEDATLFWLYSKPPKLFWYVEKFVWARSRLAGHFTAAEILCSLFLLTLAAVVHHYQHVFLSIEIAHSIRLLCATPTKTNTTLPPLLKCTIYLYLGKCKIARPFVSLCGSCSVV